MKKNYSLNLCLASLYLEEIPVLILYSLLYYTVYLCYAQSIHSINYKLYLYILMLCLNILTPFAYIADVNYIPGQDMSQIHANCYPSQNKMNYINVLFIYGW